MSTDRLTAIVLASTRDDDGERVVIQAWYAQAASSPTEYSVHYQDAEGFCYTGSYFGPHTAHDMETALRQATEAFDERVTRRGLEVAA